MRTRSSIILTVLFLCAFAVSLYAQTSPENIRAYLSISVAGKALENKDIRQAGIAEKIKDIFTSEGIQILSADDIGKPGESNINIYVTLKDSMNISAKAYYDGGRALMVRAYPAASYAFKNSEDITDSVRKYIRENITRKVQKNKLEDED